MAKPEAAATATIASFLQQLATANTENTNTNTNTHEANTNTITNAADTKYSYWN